jgi:hypothetical protein
MARAQAAGYVSKDADTDYAKMRKFVTEDQYRIEVPSTRHIVDEMAGVKIILRTSSSASGRY